MYCFTLSTRSQIIINNIILYITFKHYFWGFPYPTLSVGGAQVSRIKMSRQDNISVVVWFDA